MKGYTKIAALMGKYPESAMFSQFSALQMQNLLYWQAELVGLQEDLRELEDNNDKSQHTDKAQFATDWYELSSANKKNGDDKQWRLVLVIRERLEQYNAALLQFTQVAQLPPPHPRDLQNLQEWFRRPSMGNVFLTGRDKSVWSDGQDLIALKPNKSGVLSSWISYTMTPIYHSIVGRFHKRQDPETVIFAPNTIYYDNHFLYRLGTFIGTVLASLCPIITIAVLYFVRPMPARLGLVGIFTALFSVCLWFMTDGRLVEVFSATSAFAAVEVVFISQNITASH